MRPDRLALWQILYLMAVILFGAWVRATGAGAGCGNHWPLCNGEMILQDPSIAAMTEYTHRLSSALTLPFSILVFFLIRKYSSPAHLARKASLGTIVMIILEGLLGAGLVFLEHVADNRSGYRAISMSLHLVSTFTLMGFAVFTWYWSGNLSQKPVKLKSPTPAASLLWLQVSGLIALMFLGVSGAITALGDTLFPISAPGEAWEMGQLAGAHLFLKLRIWHPFIAILVGAWLIFVVRHLADVFSSFGAPAFISELPDCDPTLSGLFSMFILWHRFGCS